MDDACSQEDYMRRVLKAYRKTPGTMGSVRRTDRVLAAQLYQRGVSISVIENAFVLAATRRLIRPADFPPTALARRDAILTWHRWTDASLDSAVVA